MKNIINPIYLDGKQRAGIFCVGGVCRNVPAATSKSKLKEGDLVFFNISRKKNSHVGIYLKNNRFVHASSSKGVVISSLDNPYYKKAYNKGGKLK